MALSNNMSKLIDKIERRLGTRPLQLPEHLEKNKWAEIIIEDTLTTFSRYFPNKIKYEVNTARDRVKGDYCLIDENIIPGDIEILGIRDICWDEFTSNSNTMTSQQPYGMYDYFSPGYGLEDMAMIQMRADQVSLFDNGIYVEFEYPNKIRLKSSTGAVLNRSLPNFNVDLLIKHSPNLNTIAPTKMETLEELAKIDVANFLFQELKYFDGLETVYANIDLKLSQLENEASRRQELIDRLNDGYISASNDNQPIMFTV